MVDSANTCSVLVTDKVRRTVKLLCTVGQGKPIVTPHWIAQSWKCCRFEGLFKLLNLKYNIHNNLIMFLNNFPQTFKQSLYTHLNLNIFDFVKLYIFMLFQPVHLFCPHLEPHHLYSCKL